MESPTEARVRGGSRALVFWRNEKYIFGAYDDGTGELIPVKWEKSGHLWPQNSSREYTTLLDLMP